MDNFLTNAMEWIETRTQKALAEIKDIGGLQYLHSGANLKLIHKPEPSLITTNTLNSIGSWFVGPEAPNNDPDREYFISVESHQSVSLYRAKDQNEDRHEILRATHKDSGFPFNNYMDVESFIINFQTNFVESDPKNNIVDFVSKVRGEKVDTSEDSGVAQVVTVVDKVGQLQNKETQPIVKLRPHRTFSEIEQPEGLFLLRLKKIHDEICVALFEADGGAWKLTAIRSIIDYLESDSVVQEGNIQVMG